MKILLINNNPVVSRLTALSARKENVTLDEIKSISELKASDYNIIFVDGESYDNDVSNIIRNSGVEKRVLFYAQGEETNHSIFTQTILKPFLPSEVSEVLRETKVALLKEKKEENKEEKPTVDFQNLVEETKDKELEALNITEKKEPALALATPAIDSALKELKNEKKDEFDLKIEEAFPLDLNENKKSEQETISTEKERKEKESNNSKKDMFDLDTNLFELNSKKESKSTDIESDLFELDNKKETPKDGLEDNLFEIDKEIKKDILDDSPLDFDKESATEVNFSDTKENSKEEAKEIKPKIEEKAEIAKENTTKVLNNDDISNIKDILDEKEGSENLTELPSSLMSVKDILEDKEVKQEEKRELDNDSLDQDAQEQTEKKKKKKKKKKSYSDELSTGAAIAHTLSKLPVKDLRRLLRGAKVNVSIEFPNKI